MISAILSELYRPADVALRPTSFGLRSLSVSRSSSSSASPKQSGSHISTFTCMKSRLALIISTVGAIAYNRLVGAPANFILPWKIGAFMNSRLDGLRCQLMRCFNPYSSKPYFQWLQILFDVLQFLSKLVFDPICNNSWLLCFMAFDRDVVRFTKVS